MWNLEQIYKAELSYINREKVASVRYLAMLLRDYLVHFRANDFQAHDKWDTCSSFWRAYLYFLKVYLAFAIVPLDVRSSSLIDALVMVHWSA